MSLSPTHQILLDPANPHDFTEAELAEFGDALRIDLDDVQLEVLPVLRDEVGYGGPLTEVLHVWIIVAESVDALAFAHYITATLGRMLKARWRAESDALEPGDRPRKRAATIYGPDNRPLLVVEVDAEDGAVTTEEVPTSSEQSLHPRPAPPGR